MTQYLQSLISYVRSEAQPQAQSTANGPPRTLVPPGRVAVPPQASGFYEWPDEGLSEALELFTEEQERSEVFSRVSRERIDLGG